MIPLTDRASNMLSWEPVDGKQLDRLTEGLTVVGAEPINYPSTDGAILYLKDSKGDLLALEIGADIYNTETGENPFYIMLAKAKPERRAKRRKNS